jgi:PAS domain S-box-containing protein
MVPQYSGGFRIPGFDDMKWFGLWLPVLAFVGVYGLSEGLIHILELSEEMDVVADLLTIGAILTGAFFGSTSIAKVVRRKEEEALLRNHQALASLERRFHVLNESSSDALLLLNADGICRYASPSTRRLLGYAPEGLLARGGFELVHPDDREMAKAQFAASLQHPGELTHAEFRVQHQDGSWRWIDAVFRNLLADQSVQAISTNYRDITDRKQGEEALRRAHAALEARERERTEEEGRTAPEQLRATAGRLLSLQEEVRARLAREIHEELGQLLAALKLQSARLTYKLPADQPVLLESTRAMSELADSAILSIRRIATELRPSILDHLGLDAALEWQAQEFHHRTGIACEFTQELGDRPLAIVLRTTVFRIYQEILSNVARHAHATRVRIQAHEEEGSFHLTVADNGRGITQEELASRASLGLLGMQEQALLLGGHVSIVGRPGEGTTVTVQIPLSQENSEGSPAVQS